MPTDSPQEDEVRDCSAPSPSTGDGVRPREVIRPTDCLYYLISRATLLATSVLKTELEAAGVPQVRPAYLGVLLALWNQDGLGTLELGRRAGLEPSSTTGLLDRMERDELIRREAAPGDRRAQRICLTPTGKQSQRRVMEVVDRMLARGSRGVPSEEVSRTKEILRQFLSNLQEHKRGHRD